MEHGIRALDLLLDLYETAHSCGACDTINFNSYDVCRVTCLGRCGPRRKGRHDVMEVNAAGAAVSAGHTRSIERAGKLIRCVSLPYSEEWYLSQHSYGRLMDHFICLNQSKESQSAGVRST